MMALLIHELATNAAKCGAVSAPAGRVRIEWVREAATLLVDWQEMDGPPVSEASSSGFGARLIQSAFPPDRTGVTPRWSQVSNIDWEAAHNGCEGN
jgi:two-component sensor histidine kinase